MRREVSLVEVAAWLLMLWGGIHVLTLLMTIPRGDDAIDFSGLLSIFCGYLLLQRNVQAYRFILFILAAAVLPGAIIISIIDAAVIAQVMIAADISVSAAPMLRATAASLCVLIFVVVALHHPRTRDYFSLEQYGSRIWTLYLPPKRFIFVVAGTLLYGIVIIGAMRPVFSRDFYVAAIHGIQSDPRVQAAVGDVENIVIISFKYSSDVFDASWEVRGTTGKKFCRTTVKKDLATTVRISDVITTGTATSHSTGESDGDENAAYQSEYTGRHGRIYRLWRA